ncbi:MAG: hypothetical protein CVT94_07575 [Bacteroidetes bacterium HGW-Bacteroidetes-11]|jgi:hypothetical protein|nr:MAG: hypothetical protein CVT94_07575 [Bacteroidetes bacterium HGW-Bacteroidetes-11]
MKNTLFKSIAVIALSLLMITCTKEKQESQNQTDQITDEQLIERVNWFAEAANDLKDGKYLKSGEKMLIEDAILSIESAMNYKYSYTHVKFKDYYVQDVEFEIPFLATEGKTFVVDALQGFNTARQKFREIFQAINLSNKNFYMCSLKNNGIATNGAAVKVKATVYFGYGNRNVQAATNEIGYYWLIDGGDCELMGQYGAPNYLRDNYSPAIYLPCPNARVWYDQTGSFEFMNPTEYPNPNGGAVDNYCDYKLFYATTTVCHITSEVECVGSESINGAQAEIDYYRVQLQSLIDAKLSSLNKQFMDVTFVTPDQTNGTVRTIKHIPTLLYGNIHFVCPEIPIEILPITMD